MYQIAEDPVPTREQDLFSGLKLLATICSSQNIHWNDTEKYHFLGDFEPFAEHSFRYDSQSLDNSGHAKKIVSEVALNATHNTISSLENEETSAFLCKVNTCAPSSPTLYSLSSPATTHIDFFSTPPRSSTIATSSPIGAFFPKNLHETFTLNAGSMPTHISHGLSTPKFEREGRDINSTSPLVASSFLSLPKEMELSPLSSLMSSPLSSAFRKELSSDNDLSLISPSSFFAGPSGITSNQSPKMRMHTDAFLEHKPLKTPGYEPTPKKKRRKGLPSPLTSRPITFRNSRRESGILATGSPKAEKKLAVEHSRRSRKHTTMSKTKTRVKATQRQITASDKENFQSGLSPPEETLKCSLESLPLTGFLVETLALSRASAMIPSELLRAVLKSQPQLKEEHSEEEWLDIIRKILHGVKMFGTVKREGLVRSVNSLLLPFTYIYSRMPQIPLWKMNGFTFLRATGTKIGLIY